MATGGAAPLFAIGDILLGGGGVPGPKGRFRGERRECSDVYFGVEVLRLVNLVWKYRKKFMRPQWEEQLRVATS